MFQIECITCGQKYSSDMTSYVCKSCGDLLDIRYNLQDIAERLPNPDWASRPLGVWKYLELLPIQDPTEIVSLKEGGTSLHHCQKLGSRLGLEKLFVKNEGENPTGSFKDRGMTVGVTKARKIGAKAVICASTGNTASSLAAYAARAGIQCVVVIPEGKIALGKLAQAMMYGAKVVSMKGNFDQALELVMESCDQLGFYLLNSINPYRIEGQKTAAFEVCEQLGSPPDTLIIPVGNAGNISAYWKGFNEFFSVGLNQSLPRMIGIQAFGASPIVDAYKKDSDVIKPVDTPETVATAIRIGKPVSWKKALRAIHESKGMAESVTDDEILFAQKLLAREEGLFVEPASAASIAGLIKLKDLGEIDAEERVVCVTTGHGLKDPETAIKSCEEILVIEKSVEELARSLKIPIRISAAQA
ncbi:MAG: threonine synthase [Candidatus Bathyarchaeota archaeon]|nr:MAG: threonine synthase [Candidatus Bathyarchaeota archaeon]